MKISLNQASIHDKRDFIAKFYLEKKTNPEFNTIFVECINRHYKTKLKNATRIYFVIEGKGYFIIDNIKQEANLYDLFIIKDSQIYEYRGKMKLIEINFPATDKSNEEKLE
jgi:gentisate 1,2-dioxygenase